MSYSGIIIACRGCLSARNEMTRESELKFEDLHSKSKKEKSCVTDNDMVTMQVIRLHTSPILSRNAIRPSLIHLNPIFRSTCLRKYAQSSSPIPPPQHSTTTSQSSGLNHQLHPEGRPPLSAKPRPTSTTAQSAKATESNVNSTATAENPNPATVYRTPLRTTSSNIPIAARDTVKLVYEGPFRKTVRGIKAFSISSLVLSTTMTPFILTMEAPLPMVARVAMITTGPSSPITYANNQL